MELASSHEVAKGRFVSSKLAFGPKRNGGFYTDAKVAYADSMLDKPEATWEVSVIQPLNRLRGTKLTLRMYKTHKRTYFRLPGYEKVEIGARGSFYPPGPSSSYNTEPESRPHHAMAKG